MERGGDISSGFNVLDKESLSNSSWTTKLQFCTEGMMNNLGRPFVGGGGAGPTHSSGGAHEAQGGSIYRDGGHLFNIFPSRPQGGGGMMMGLPFTAAQLKELQKQALIYKYMISSVPVPIHLLPQLSRTFPAVDSSIYSGSGRYSKNGDPEPGRCKRTDGKKWRCSKDVAPSQKYCERHLHRGRPRSRKPVEDKNAINGESNRKKNSTNHFSATNNDKPLTLFNPENDLNISKSNAPSCNRDLSLMMMESELKRQRLIETNLGFSNSIYASSSLFDHDYQLNPLPPYTNFAASEIDAPISFIDAWSIENGNVESIGPREPESLSPSLNLSISMASGRHSDHEMARVTCGDDTSVTEPVYWGPFTGGPLAEAFNNPASPHGSVTTAVDSPTGVLHRSMFSHSDGSVCNSPTFPAPMSEVAFRWLN